MNAPAKISAVEAPDADMPRWLPHALVALIIATLVVSLAAMAIWEERIRYRERAEVATQNVSHMLDLHLSSVFDKIDVVLQSTVAQYQEQLAGGKVRPLELKLYLERQQALVPEIISLRIIDRDGVVRYGAGIPGGGPVNLGDREYFLRARDGSASELIIAGPLMGRIAKQWVVTLSRRIEAPDGTFAGVVYAAIPTVHFERILASVSLGPQGAASIRTADLALVHRYPSTRNAVGSREVSQELLDMLRRHPTDGQYLARTSLDGVERNNAYRRLESYPFYVIVGMASRDYLGGWQEHSLILGGLAALAVLAIGLAAWLMYRSAERLRADLAVRKRIGTELETLLEERTRLATELAERADEAEAANRAKSTFLAKMSHELRTPLNHIMGFTTILQREVQGPRGQDHLHKVEQASQRLLELINSILDVSSIESGKITLALRDFGLAELLEEARQGLAEAAAAKGIGVQVVSDPALPARLHGDPERIRQVLNGLLDNAIKFSEQGPVILRAHRVPSDDGNVRVRFEVSDQGIGVAPELRDNLFQIFNQGDNSSTRRYGGAGLGLALCKRLVALMLGEIGCTSAPGDGSTFWFTLPLGAVDENPGVLGAGDWQRVRHVLAELEALLAADNFQAQTLWKRYTPLLHAALGPGARACDEAIDSIDFDTALRCLREARRAVPELRDPAH